ncbi:radical SAM domain protein [Parvularcula bermudensis HTCC2503]|uniref:Radical SAM domain protein n=1 Tax=Parvularcula bermudensis (strain ATCC BAA-594 / HTCC2503 / KCTC 12087) TaxID=314260 RepID=E0TGJ7_PARBH|nr:radical SAM protein [Parvularcula bermudensis]ADM09616.1 radical SAM domain protein [Parvularcula bermudensis HTCC2503]
MADGDLPAEKFSHPHLTAKGETRAWVPLRQLETLWLNTGTLCNIACENCYILSSPQNDDLVYLSRDEARPYLDEAREMGAREIGITGGEPFMNPDIMGILEDALDRGFDVLVLTNAMKPMMRPRITEGLMALSDDHKARLTLRVSMDHHDRAHHDVERGEGSYAAALMGIEWLARNGFSLAIAGRSIWGEDEATARHGYGEMLETIGVSLDVMDPKRLVIFAEMREEDDPPEITTGCWDILGKRPDEIMCSSSRMVVKRKGAAHPVVLSCTLIAYDERFEMGRTLKEASRSISLNHKWCATFCVLGGSSCS